jgi:uncharacterized membrane-anchored protein
MQRNFRRTFALLVGWQVLLLMFLMASKGITLATGATVVLKTVPVDPRELFRGEYVALRYEISALDLTRLRNELQHSPLRPGDRVYAVLAPTTERGQKTWWAIALYDKKPSEEELAGDGTEATLIRGTVARHQDKTVEVDYGIESYFVPEGEGPKLEQAPPGALTVEVRIDAGGRAVIKRVLLHGKPV